MISHHHEQNCHGGNGAISFKKEQIEPNKAEDHSRGVMMREIVAEVVLQWWLLSFVEEVMGWRRRKLSWCGSILMHFYASRDALL
jgi:hypothetical protein